MRYLAPLVVLTFAGCGGKPGPAHVKGTLAFDGQPFPLPAQAGEVFLVFHKVGDDGSINQFQMYTALVRGDGSFEVVSSGGELPVGTYQVAIDAASGKVVQFKPFALKTTKARVEFQSGSNDVTLDLAKLAR